MNDDRVEMASTAGRRLRMYGKRSLVIHLHGISDGCPDYTMQGHVLVKDE